MILTLFCFLLFTDGNATGSRLSHADNQTFNLSSDLNEDDCSVMDVLNYLNFTKDRDLFTLIRPVRQQKERTYVSMNMKIQAILGVNMAEQTFTSYIWTVTKWKNVYTVWKPEDFCGIRKVKVPSDRLWKPDLTIEEMIEKDKAPPSPFLQMLSDGTVYYRNDQVVVTTCKLDVYKFPFDTQSCKISFKSVLFSDEELNLYVYQNNSALTARSRKIMDSQYEWLFLYQSVVNKTGYDFGYPQTAIVYTITMQRMSSLYVANFLLPVLFFLCLDFSSLLMSDSGGEKVGFKITVLLAVTVMQLLLNEILPCTSRRIPLIVIYCVGTFALMLISLLEAILMKYLVTKDSAWLKEDRVIKKSRSITDEMGDQTSSLSKEGNNSQLTEIFLTMEKVSDDLEEIKKTISLLSNTNNEVKPGYWTKLAKKINKIFAGCYFTGVTVFLLTVFSLWLS